MRAIGLAVGLLLASCATPPRAPGPLRIAAWNMEHLAEHNGSGCRPRQEADYAALRAYADSLEADVIAFQEVESGAAAARVFDPARYQIVIETRAGGAGRLECRGLPGQHLNRQATGFAVRRGLHLERLPDVTALQLGDENLRSGVDIRVHAEGGPSLRLMSMHLKSGCASGASAEPCPTLFAQARILEDWIDARAAEQERFAVLGDFNRRLSAAGDAIWADLDDQDPIDLRVASEGVNPSCDPRYTSFIDYVVLAGSAQGVFREWTFAGPRLSDHCAISVDLH